MEDEVVTEGFLLPRKTSARAAGREEPGGLQNQKLSISLGAGTGGCRPGCLGNPVPGSCGKGLPGSLGPWTRGCRELNAEFAMGKGETIGGWCPRETTVSFNRHQLNDCCARDRGWSGRSSKGVVFAVYRGLRSVGKGSRK